jgi:hypothetical protein
MNLLFAHAGLLHGALGLGHGRLSGYRGGSTVPTCAVPLAHLWGEA